ncbi:UDP-N-acetyl-D-mannosaminuronic acid transferase [Actinoplanes philippinensis]|uniref:N-acetylglucosaminyldiphosphoundecaprenol N-acetyl-beta-D-mannosaminyltransferase n=1 Tax=Actinoplanes philippinensis TaxID=35752 RepID=A0A1I2IK82_9ACTN|nr:WecB/TagA/CpsF family glycosyltransferase [Actinoplanes philippinensis]GIE79242.1 UDP-N-acetyl-D-mannosaminuronic acid transferase [Actinoplanes philippinensis]SFF42802.1 N-acetylglucosaminyldiphosphoundecaprenol N-acetyl-beta-D-mannosaminyltransferase [Actinoplanes philippinensis]
MTIEAFERVQLDGTGIDRITEDEVVAVVREALAHGRGGRIITPNVDILRRAAADPAVRRHLDDADLIVADGMPLVWASRLGGVPLPERVAGSSLIWSLSEGLGRDARSVFVVGGTPASLVASKAARGAGPDGAGGTLASVVATRTARNAGPDGAARAGARLAETFPGLRIAGTLSPDYGFEEDEAAYAGFCATIVAARPDLVFVGLGFPKQEVVIERLRPELPGTWFVGCGAAVNFVAGDVGRAPRWMQRTGLEWAHRLGVEPRRLAGRYLRHDAPYALRLLARGLSHSGLRSSPAAAPAEDREPSLRRLSAPS